MYVQNAWLLSIIDIFCLTQKNNKSRPPPHVGIYEYLSTDDLKMTLDVWAP